MNRPEAAFGRLVRFPFIKREAIIMKTFKAVLLAATVSLSLAACGQSAGGRAVSGGLLGAGAGAGVGALTGGSVGTGALVGGGIGAAGGALTAPRRY
ncbi:hypothetical protein JMJ56_07295 [Belnapia sp. T18]|uniref:Glycine zipper domain-containing protein n=1 Tax=Belnapia arida TaxID=2804533 RepID=A0ABS1TZG7_9PROT|nr:hypothetical protein [Belnapia arida]MBL6077804.1 hypothetical protein [Belnapia arida]